MGPRAIEALKLFPIAAAELHFASCSAIGPIMADQLFCGLRNDPEPNSAVVYFTSFSHLEAWLVSVYAADAVLTIG